MPCSYAVADASCRSLCCHRRGNSGLYVLVSRLVRFPARNGPVTAPPMRMSIRAVRVKPRDSPRASASEKTAISVPSCMLMIIFIDAPIPVPPRCRMVFPMRFRSGVHSSRSFCSPPTRNVSSPFSAKGSEPVTGASMKRRPRAAASDAICLLKEGLTVLQSTQRDPFVIASRNPFFPTAVAETASGLESIVNRTSAARAASAAVDATRAPSAWRVCDLPGVRLKTVRWCPARRRFRAMRLPMIPKPRNPMFTGSPFDLRARARPVQSLMLSYTLADLRGDRTICQSWLCRARNEPALLSR